MTRITYFCMENGVDRQLDEMILPAPPNLGAVISLPEEENNFVVTSVAVFLDIDSAIVRLERMIQYPNGDSIQSPLLSHREERSDDLIFEDEGDFETSPGSLVVEPVPLGSGSSAWGSFITPTVTNTGPNSLASLSWDSLRRVWTPSSNAVVTPTVQE